MKISKLVVTVATLVLALHTNLAFAESGKTRADRQPIDRTPVYGEVGGRGYDAISKSDTTKQFYPQGYITLQDGINWSMRQGMTVGTIANNLMVGGGYNFTPVVGLRGLFGYTQGRGKVENYYGYEYLELFGDITLNVSNLFGGYRHNRALDIVPYIGIGTNIGLNSCNSSAVNPSSLDCRWEPVKAFLAGRVGLLGNIRVFKNVYITGDVNWTCAPDNFNSKTEGFWDSNVNFLVGAAVSFDPKYRKVSRAEARHTAALAGTIIAPSLMDVEAIIRDARKSAHEAEVGEEDALDGARVAEAAYLTNTNPETKYAAKAAAVAAAAAAASATDALAKADALFAAAAKADSASIAAAAAVNLSDSLSHASGVSKNKLLEAASAAQAADAQAKALVAAATTIINETIDNTVRARSLAKSAHKAADDARKAALLPAVIDPGAPIDLDPAYCHYIFFDLDCDYVNDKSWKEILSVVRWLFKHDDAKLHLIGYASAESGGPAYNMDLSRRRVEKVKYYLRQNGIDPSRISIEFRGETEQPFKNIEQNRVVIIRQVEGRKSSK